MKHPHYAKNQHPEKSLEEGFSLPILQGTATEKGLTHNPFQKTDSQFKIKAFLMTCINNMIREI
jgi:hypothetical protein